MSAASRNDNTLARARAVNLSSNSKKFSDRIGGNDPKDFYRIQLNNRSQLKISINSFQSNATAALLDREGQVLQRSNRSGRKIKPIQQTLDPGTYHIRIASRRRDQSSQYRLTLKANPTALPTPIAPPSLPLPSPTLPEAVPTVDKARFNIRFDYRFDTIGWFTPDKRAALEAAARVWESIILDEFAEIPVGTRTLRVFNPETGRFISDGFTTDQVIDDVVIFVGSRELGGSFFSSTLAEAAPAGSLEPRITGADFEPWIGSIS
ncbi:MAG: hypothetical protein HC865_25175, partial [Cyanobacteria bacterium RU_5_0]|nr:hypothetical protein [Cyanobacteria bacterium RU_5_0]